MAVRTLEEENEALREALEEAANLLAEYVNDAYPPERRGMPSYAHRYVTDMKPVVKAYRLLGFDDV